MRATTLLFAILIMAGCGAGTAGTGGGGSGLMGGGAPTPNISALIPSSAPMGSAPFVMTVNGSNFAANSLVYWGSSQCTTKFISQNQMTAVVTDSDLQQSGSFGVYVRTNDATSNVVDFDVQ